MYTNFHNELLVWKVVLFSVFVIVVPSIGGILAFYGLCFNFEQEGLYSECLS